MYIKYSDGGKEQVLVLTNRKRFHFVRNVWKDIPDEYCDEILKNPEFISNDDEFFDRKSFYNANKIVALKRFSALGDIIQLIPIVHHLNSISNNKYILYTQLQYVELFKSFNVFYDVINELDDRIDKVIHLDGVLESDHILGNEDCYLHRIKIYEKYFGINIEKHCFKVYNEIKTG